MDHPWILFSAWVGAKMIAAKHVFCGIFRTPNVLTIAALACIVGSRFAVTRVGRIDAMHLGDLKGVVPKDRPTLNYWFKAYDWGGIPPTNPQARCFKIFV